MSKKKWIVAGGIVVALVAATVIGRQLTGKTTASAQSSSGDSDKVTTLQVAHTQTMCHTIMSMKMVKVTDLKLLF